MLSIMRYSRATSVIALIAAQAFSAHAYAKQTIHDDDEIIVSARKRDEVSIAVPVVITAIGQRELERRGITNLDTLSRVVPQLISSEGGGTTQGGVIALRGVAGAEANPFADQAVSFNIDGVQIARSSVRRLSQMDMAQVEVLKGPQALFFGKNSPGGIISIRTADSTPDFAAKLSGGYEFEGHEWVTDGFVSGPLSDTLGARIAFFADDMRGWVKNVVPKDQLLASPNDYLPKNSEFAIRGTLKFEPSDRFDARLKFTYNHAHGGGAAQNQQFFSCPGGTPVGNPYDDCTPNATSATGILGQSFNALGAPFGDGLSDRHQNQILGSLEMNYKLNDALTLTSVSGFYRFDYKNQDNFTYTINPSIALPSQPTLYLREISEELRLTSKFTGPLNFMVGGHFQDSHATTSSVTYLNALAPKFINNYFLVQDGTAWSVFGQALLNVAPTLELSVGGRYSEERKNLPFIAQATAALQPRVQVSTINDHGTWNNFSPEITLSWRPSQKLTVFGSYKKGFLSGGFNSGSTNFTTNLLYDQQLIRGFEGGVKASLLDGALRTNLSVYSYIVSGLQVTTVPAPAVQVITNAGKATTRGAEFDFTYRTPLDGLALHGAIAYNHARYDVFTTSCYRGQTFATGCSAGLPNASGFYSLQDLAGQQIARAPDWSGNAGFSFEHPVASGFKLGLSGDLTYSSSFFTNSINVPQSRQRPYTLLDASVRLVEPDDRWEVALIGRNLANRFFVVRSTETSFTGTAPNSATPRLADLAGIVSRGRELMVRLTYRIGK